MNNSENYNDISDLPICVISWCFLWVLSRFSAISAISSIFNNSLAKKPSIHWLVPEFPQSVCPWPSVECAWTHPPGRSSRNPYAVWIAPSSRHPKSPTPTRIRNPWTRRTVTWCFVRGVFKINPISRRTCSAFPSQRLNRSPLGRKISSMQKSDERIISSFREER